MASFVKTSTLIRTAQRNADGSVTFFNPPQTIASWSSYVDSVEAAIALLPVNQRPPVEQWGGYAMTYAPRAYFTVDVVGVVRDTDILVTHLTIWQRFQDRTLPPPIIDSLAMQINGPLRDMEAPIREQIDAMLIRHTARGTNGDFRDLTLDVTTDPAHDPAGLLTRADIQRIDGAAVRYD